ncbi:MAG TPA: ATP-binding cassette domain-containing protein [Acidimicrobiales bacterium]|nr:ATP-binding cassette domain-containing protein [Acidimicrobiales bacterium]
MRRSPLAWLGGLLALYLAIPLVAFFVRLSTSDQRGFGTPGLWSALRTSVESATISTAVIAVFGVPLAYALARHRGIMATLLGGVVALPLALPPVMGGILLIYLVGPYTTIGRFFDGRLTGSVAGIVLSQIFVAAPFLIISARSSFASVDRSLEDLAASLGHRPVSRFFRVDLPVASAGIRAGLLLTWLRAIGEYGANVVVAYHPYSLPVFTYVQFSGAGIPTTQAPTTLVLAAAVVAVAVSQIRLPRRKVELPAPEQPVAVPPTPVSFDLDVRAGAFHLRLAHRARSHRLAILGPSGSGKSMTLRCIAGLVPGAGAVAYGGEPQPRVEERRVGYVPQGQNLFPHLDVAAQVLFGRDSEPGLARYWLETLGLGGLEPRRPEQLSGGQRQRVSLAAALARRPALVLLDEPFSALDAPVRAELRQEVRRLQLGGLSTVLVTHDAEEAALLADEVLVVSDGRLLQAGPTAEVYERPASPEVARLVGFQLLTGVVAAGGIRCGDLVVAADCHDIEDGQQVVWGVRIEQVTLGAGGRYEAPVVDVARLGAVAAVTLSLEGGDLRVRTSEPVWERARFDLDRVMVWPATVRSAAGSPSGALPPAPTR